MTGLLEAAKAVVGARRQTTDDKVKALADRVRRGEVTKPEAVVAELEKAGVPEHEIPAALERMGVVVAADTRAAELAKLIEAQGDVTALRHQVTLDETALQAKREQTLESLRREAAGIAARRQDAEHRARVVADAERELKELNRRFKAA